MTRTRSKCGKANDMAQQHLNSIKDDLINKEVAEIAITLHGLLSVISNEYSSEAIVDLVPEITSLLNRYDASIKVNDDLKMCINDMAEENQLLLNSLKEEKNKRNIDFEDSIHSEEMAEVEIKKLKMEIVNLKLEMDRSNSTDSNLTQGKITSLNEDIKSQKNEIKGLNKQIEQMLATIETMEADNLCLQNAIAALKLHSQSTNVKSGNTKYFPSPPCKSKLIKSTPSTVESSRITIFADSHGKKIVNFVSRRVNCKVYGMIKTGACFDDVTSSCIKECEGMTNSDTVVLIGGTNDMNNFNSKKLLSSIKRLLPSLTHVSVILMNIPKRYDLPFSSNMHYQIERTNFEMDKVCKRFKNVKLLDVSNLGRRCHTPHGLHLNSMGKRFISDFIEKEFVETDRDLKRPPIAVDNECGAEEEIPVITAGRPFLEIAQPIEEETHT